MFRIILFFIIPQTLVICKYFHLQLQLQLTYMFNWRHDSKIKYPASVRWWSCIVKKGERLFIHGYNKKKWIKHDIFETFRNTALFQSFSAGRLPPCQENHTSLASRARTAPALCKRDTCAGQTFVVSGPGESQLSSLTNGDAGNFWTSQIEISSLIDGLLPEITVQKRCFACRGK